MYYSIVMIPWLFFGRKDGFDHLETYWLFYVFNLLWLFKINPVLASIILIILLILKETRYMLVWICNFLISFVTGERGKLMGNVSSWLFTDGLNLKIINNNAIDSPAIYLFNYPANSIEYYATFLFKPMKLFVSSDAQKYASLTFGNNFIIGCDNDLETSQEKVEECISGGTNVIAYIERSFKKRTNKWRVASDLRSGMFIIAKRLNIPLFLVCASHINHTLGIITDNQFKIIISPKLNTQNISVKQFKNYARNFWNTNLKALES